MISNNDDMALGAIDALKLKGHFNNGKYMPVVGVDATVPALKALEDGKVYMDVYSHVHKKMSTEINSISNDSWSKSKQAASQAKLIMGIIFFISIVASLIVSIRLSQNIVIRLNNCVTSLKEIAKGNLIIEPIKIVEKDEVGELGSYINTMTSNLKNIVGTVLNASEQVAILSEELHNGAEQSTEVVSEVTETITEIAHGAENQSKASGEASAVVEQISAGAQQVAANSINAANVANQASTIAKEGSNVIVKAVNQMATIKKSTKIVENAVEKLNDNSVEIGQIVDTISAIASQTNLLALNAAIEAAHAGENGRGFAIVAQEVRELAEQSSDATQKIAKLIEQVKDDTKVAVIAMKNGAQDVNIGTKVVNSAGKAFSEIVRLVSEVSLQIEDTSETLQQLASGTEQIVLSVDAIDTISKETAIETQTISSETEELCVSMEEITSSSHNLSNLAQQLRNAVNEFKI